MSFICQHCGSRRPAGEQPNKTITKIREKFYPQVVDEEGEVVGHEGYGHETVQELNLCKKCSAKVATPEVVK